MEGAADRFVVFLIPHLYLTVFVVSAIDAIGIPFPGRIVLVLAGAFASTRVELALAIIASAFGSERCVENTLRYFRRFGAAAIVLARYSTSVRLFASILSGCGHFAYRRFVLYDLAGSLAYAALWVVLGHVFSDQVEQVLEWLGRQPAPCRI